MVAAMASTSSMSKPVRLPLSTYSIGGKVASVATVRTCWAWAVVARASRAVRSRRRVVMEVPWLVLREKVA
jgi:hypothetical protein